MFKKIKKYFHLQRLICFEVLETLATICLFLDHEGNLSRPRNPYSDYMKDHFNMLKSFSDEIRNDLKR